MGNSRSGTVLIGVAIVTVVLLSGCPTGVAGSISGHSFSEGWTVESAAGVPISAILMIDPPVRGQSVIVTGDGGFFELEDVPAGVYEIAPLHIDSVWAKQVTVRAGRESTVFVPTPEIVVEMLDFNLNVSDPPCDNVTVRRALSAALDRAALAASLDSTACLTFFPTQMDISTIEDGLDSAPDSNLAGANADLTALSDFSIELLYNDSSTVTTYMGELTGYLEAVSRVTSVNETVLPFDSYLGRREDGNYELSRLGWALDSNNLAEYLGIWRTGGWTRYSNPAFDDLLDDANTAISVGDVGTYETKIVEAHNLLIQDMPSIPVLSR